MADRMGVENALQKGLAEEAVEIVSPRQVAIQRVLPLKDDQGAYFSAREISGRLGDDLRAFVERGRGKKTFPESPKQGKCSKKRRRSS